MMLTDSLPWLMWLMLAGLLFLLWAPGGVIASRQHSRSAGV